MTTIVCYKGQIAADSRQTKGKIRMDARIIKLRILPEIPYEYELKVNKEKVKDYVIAGAGAGNSASIDVVFDCFDPVVISKDKISLNHLLNIYRYQLTKDKPNAEFLFLLKSGDAARLTWEGTSHDYQPAIRVSDKDTLVTIGSGSGIVKLLHEIVPNLNAVDYVALARVFDKGTGGLIEHYSHDKNIVGSYKKMSDKEIKYVLDALKDKLNNPELPLGRA